MTEHYGCCWYRNCTKSMRHTHTHSIHCILFVCYWDTNFLGESHRNWVWVWCLGCKMMSFATATPAKIPLKPRHVAISWNLHSKILWFYCTLPFIILDLSIVSLYDVQSPIIYNKCWYKQKKFSFSVESECIKLQYDAAGSDSCHLSRGAFQ